MPELSASVVAAAQNQGSKEARDRNAYFDDLQRLKRQYEDEEKRVFLVWLQVINLSVLILLLLVGTFYYGYPAAATAATAASTATGINLPPSSSLSTTPPQPYQPLQSPPVSSSLGLDY